MPPRIKPTAANQTGESGQRFGSGSSSGLHAKTLDVGSRRIFVGSFNFERTASGDKHYDTEPETDGSTRMGVELLSILAIEWLL